MAFQDEKDAQSLEQMTDEEFWQHARLEAAKAATVLSPSDSAALHQYLECGLQRGKCFVPLHAIEAVIPASPPFARLPFAPRWLHGVQAWRGEIVAVVNLDDYLSNIDPPVNGPMARRNASATRLSSKTLAPRRMVRLPVSEGCRIQA